MGRHPIENPHPETLARRARSRRLPNRQGKLTDHERNIAAALVTDSPGPITDIQEQALAVALRRTPAAIKTLIESARANFAAKAGRYVDIHSEATEAALKSGTVTGLQTALSGSQWAIERIAQDGARVVDKAAQQDVGQKIVIGIQMGGISPSVMDAK